jgi:beta-N-acetylhexosaminidase
MMIFIISGCGKGRALDDNGNGGGVVQPSPTPTDIPAPTVTPVPSSSGDPILDRVNAMALDEKIGQIVMSGIDGYTINDDTIKMIKDYHVGGFIVLGENVRSTDQLLKLVNALKKNNSGNDIPLFLGIDQEGGRIDRLPAEFKRFPTNEKIGKVNNGEFSFAIGGALAEEVRAFGFNIDFAPVLDINSNPDNQVIGNRSFGADPDIVTKLGIRTMAGIQSGGIISVVKHFPGHGDTSVDSHVGLPKVDNDLSRLKSFELIPFKQAVRDRVDVVMAAHILLPKIDPKYPSSMSKTIITDILRGDISFDGVVITDDMTMGAIMKNYDIGNAAVTSVNAGCDIILVCHGNNNEVAVVKALKKAVQNGTITEERVNKSVYRILKLKEKYKISDKAVKSVDVGSINKKIESILENYMK